MRKTAQALHWHHIMAETFVDPSRTNFDHFKLLSRDTPIEMLNLIRYRDTAAYPATHTLAASGLSGAEAYALYGAESAPVFARVGGSIVYSGTPHCTLIGPEDEVWDAMFVARYPHAGAFLDMVTDPEYRRAVVHRQAAVLTSRLIRMAPRAGGTGFAD